MPASRSIQAGIMGKNGVRKHAPVSYSCLAVALVLENGTLS
jgi:hypothetical protein